MSDAITRKESLLKSIADGTSSSLKPITREEQYLAYIAGETNSFPLEPITREEAFLDKIAKSGAGGGGSTINVQPLTATENGTYDAPEGQAYDPVTVDVKAVTEPITITENGVYPVPKVSGGALDYGKEATFKNKITVEEITNYLDGVGFEIQTDAAQSTLMYTLEDGTLMIGWSNGALIPEEAGYHVMVLPNEAEITGTGYAYLAGFPSYPDGGWYAINMVAGQIVPWATPITVAFTTPDPDRPYMATPNFELLSVFFDIETKSLDGWGDITVNVAGGGGDSGDIVFPDDKKTHLLVSIKDTSRMPIPFNIYVDGDVVLKIDWGDGNTETFPFTTNWLNPKHTYTNVGDYVVTIEKTWGDGWYKLGNGYDSSAVIGGNEKGGYYSVLKKAHIGQGTKVLQNSTFAYCMYLESVSMEDNITALGTTVFNLCYSLKEVIFSNGITSIPDDCLKEKQNLRKVVLPNKITSIPNSLFYNCHTLADVTMGDTITSIGTYAFSNCRCLRGLVMPASLTSIGDNAFAYCEAVKTYDFSKCTSVPTLSGTRVFNKNASDVEFLVPSALYDEWIAATNWSTLASKIVAV